MYTVYCRTQCHDYFEKKWRYSGYHGFFFNSHSVNEKQQAHTGPRAHTHTSRTKACHLRMRKMWLGTWQFAGYKLSDKSRFSEPKACATVRLSLIRQCKNTLCLQRLLRKDKEHVQVVRALFQSLPRTLGKWGAQGLCLFTWVSSFHVKDFLRLNITSMQHRTQSSPFTWSSLWY